MTKTTDIHGLREGITQRLLDLPVPQHVVDLCCGKGALSLRVSQLFADCYVTGIDAVSDDIRQASQAAMESGVGSRVNFDRNDQRTIPLADETVDIVTGVSALASSTLPQGLLTEIYRVLVPGGHVILGEWIAVDRGGPPAPNLPRLLNTEAPAPPEKRMLSWIETSAFEGVARWDVMPETEDRAAVLITLHKAMRHAGRGW